MKITLYPADVAALLSKALNVHIEAASVEFAQESLVLDNVDFNVLLVAQSVIQSPAKPPSHPVFRHKASEDTASMSQLLNVNDALKGGATLDDTLRETELTRPLAGNEYADPPEVTPEELLWSVGKRR